MANERKFVHDVGEADLRWLLDVMPGQVRRHVMGRRHLVTISSSETYVVLPSDAHPWGLVPRLSALAAVRSLTAAFRLQSKRSKVTRAAMGVALLLGGRHGASTGVPVAGKPSPPSRQETLSAVLSRRLGQPVLSLVMVGEADPNRKPTLQLVDPRGHTVGYAKVGWDEPTRRLVENEGTVLDLLSVTPTATPGLPRRPKVRAAADIHGLRVLVTEPLPRRARRWPHQQEPSAVLTRAVATALSRTGTLVEYELADLPIWRRQLAELAAAAGREPSASTAMTRVVRTLTTASLGTPVVVGGWHGDLVPWNLALRRGAVWAWDWEHAADDVPLGFDLIHYRFAVLLHVHRLGTPAAVAALRSNAFEWLAPLAVRPDAVDALVTGYLVERWLRAFRLSRSGTTWDRAIHPVLVEILSEGNQAE